MLLGNVFCGIVSLSKGSSDLRAEDESVSDIRLMRAGQDKIVTSSTIITIKVAIIIATF